MFCIMRTEKRKRTDLGGIQRENTRTATEYNNKVSPGMDIFNVTLKESSNWLQDINNEIKAAGAKTRSNSVLALDTIYTASPDFFQGKTNQQNDDFFKDCLQFHQEHFGHIISAVIHYDETTPHLHVISVPLTKDNRLSARDVIGNKAKMSKTQDAFFEQVGRGYGLERGIHMDGQEKKQHISAQEHELHEIKQQIAREQEKLEAIEHSEETARTRAQEFKQKTAELQKQIEQLQERIDNLQEQLEYARADYKKAYNRCKRAERRAADLQEILTAAERRQVEQIRQEQEQERFEDDGWELE